MYILENNVTITHEQIEVIAQQSAQYLHHALTEDSADMRAVVFTFARWRALQKPILAFFNIRAYCRDMGHPLPERFDELAYNGNAFDYYHERLTHHLIEYSALQSV